MNKIKKFLKNLIERNGYKLKLYVGKDYARYNDLGWHVFIFGYFKLRVSIVQGASIIANKEKGFYIRFYFWVPFDK